MREGGAKVPPPYKHDISLSNLAVLLTLRLLSGSIMVVSLLVHVKSGKNR